MAELRTDPITGVRALVGGVGDGPGPAPSAHLPFVLPGTPAFGADAPEPAAEANRDLFLAAAATGTHERIAPPVAVRRFAELDDAAAHAFAEQWRTHLRAGADAGAASLHLSLDDRPDAELCADLFALPFVPAALARERERFSAYATRTMGGNLLADLVQEEVRRRARVVAIDGEAVLVTPWASRVPFQVAVLPRRPRARYEDDGPSGAAMLLRAVRALGERLGGEAPLSLWVRTAPQGAEHYAWRIDVLPRLGAPGAFELGTGIPVCDVAPERAAAELREAVGS